jgi:hypothetical protein
MMQRIDALFVRVVKYWLASSEGLSALLCAPPPRRVNVQNKFEYLCAVVKPNDILNSNGTI